MKCEMCTGNVKDGVAGKGSRSKGCSGAEYCQTCSKALTGAVAVRAALGSAVQLEQCDDVNRQAEMANLPKCMLLGHACTSYL
jgi:hypothetical protein